MPKPSISSTNYEQSAWLTFQGVSPVEGDPPSPELFALSSTCLHTVLAALLEQAEDYFATTTREVDDEVDHFRGWHDDQELADAFTYQHLQVLAERTRRALLEQGDDSRPDYATFEHLFGLIAQLAANEALLDSYA
jgi:hypothetical protein